MLLMDDKMKSPWLRMLDTNDQKCDLVELEKFNRDPKRTTWNYSLSPYQQYSCLFGLANVFSMFGDSIPVFESVHDQGYVSKSNQGHAARAGLGAANSTCI